jgi:hypothetical protein
MAAAVGRARPWCKVGDYSRGVGAVGIHAFRTARRLVWNLCINRSGAGSIYTLRRKLAE